VNKDYYKILEVHPEASLDVIKKAYKILALRYHPDKHHSSRKRIADIKFKEISEAYDVLSNPVKRRAFDRAYNSSQKVAEPGKANAEINEKAYYYYRIGLAHYQNAQKKTAWKIFTGKIASELKKARDNFLKIINEFTTSKYAENAYFYNICILMESNEYDHDFLQEIEERLYEFLSEFPRSKWIADVKLNTVKFYLFKKRKVEVADKLLTDIILHKYGTGYTREAEILLEYARRGGSPCPP
jgi:curved DNA-binding protein CbpA